MISCRAIIIFDRNGGGGRNREDYTSLFFWLAIIFFYVTMSRTHRAFLMPQCFILYVTTLGHAWIVVGIMSLDHRGSTY